MMIEVDDDEFEAVRAIIKTHAGIHLSPAKRTLVAARLTKRLQRLGLSSIRDYCAHVLGSDPQGKELREMINCLTTNKTEFFREAHHFDFLRTHVVPEMCARAQRGGKPTLRIWSAGCSTGQEPYTIAMVLAEIPALEGWDVRILASDIDTRVLAVAEAAEYPASFAAEIPEPLRRKYLEPHGDGVRIARGLRDMVRFRQINLIEEAWPIRSACDAIFCRNVVIYFDRETQNRLYQRLAAQLAPHGYLFAGHSENLGWIPHLFQSVGLTVYGKASSAKSSERKDGEAVGRVALRSGDVFASRSPTVVSTLLGSCVAVCVFDEDARIGGINHVMVPGSDGGPEASTRYGEQGMHRLFDEVRSLGARPSRLRAKIVGGANVVSFESGIPEGNVRFAREFLTARNVPIVAECIGGSRPIELEFETHTGRAFARRREPTHELGGDASAVGRS